MAPSESTSMSPSSSTSDQPAPYEPETAPSIDALSRPQWRPVCHTLGPILARRRSRAIGSTAIHRTVAMAPMGRRRRTGMARHRGPSSPPRRKVSIAAPSRRLAQYRAIEPAKPEEPEIHATWVGEVIIAHVLYLVAGVIIVVSDFVFTVLRLQAVLFPISPSTRSWRI